MLLVDERVGVVRGGGLYRALQQGAWVAGEELFQRVSPGDAHPQRIISSPTRSSPLLPEAGDGSGISHGDGGVQDSHIYAPVSYTHLRAHETKANLVCRLLLEKK